MFIIISFVLICLLFSSSLYVVSSTFSTTDSFPVSAMVHMAMASVYSTRVLSKSFGCIAEGPVPTGIVLVSQ